MKRITRLFTLAMLPAAMTMGILSPAYALQLTGIDMKPSNGSSEIRLNFDSAVTQPRGFMLQNPPRLVLDVLNASMGYSIPKHQKGAGVVNAIDVVEASRRIRMTLRLNSTVNYSTRIEGNQLVISLNGGSANAYPNSSAMGTKAKQQWADNVVPKNAIPDDQMLAALQLVEGDQAVARYQNAMRPKAPSRQVAPMPSQQYQQVQGNVQYQAPLRPAQRPQNPYRPVPGRTRALIDPTTVMSATSRQLPNNSYQSRQSPRSSGMVQRNLGHVDFRRDTAGNGRVIIDLPDAEVETTDNRAGNILSLLIKGVKYPKGQRRLDVVDFGTPVNYVNIIKQGDDTKVQVAVSGNYRYEVKRAPNGRQLYVDVKKIDKKATAEDLAKKKKEYTGEKLTLNFQDIEVRSVLQLLADFTNKNIVVSDSVKGNITLRLKDVPWDQAMDIVLSSKALSMRKNGNVIWVAPTEELAAREQRELDEIEKKKKHESLVTEYIPVNFAKATELVELIRSKTGEDSRSLLSPRGSITFDNRTNTLLVQDTAEQVAEIRSLVKVLDVAVRQVAIESRIVIADDNFSKELGSRFGVTSLVSFNGKQGLMTSSGTSTSTAGIIKDAGSNLNSNGSVFPVSVPSLNDRLNVNLPVTGAAGSFGFSLLAKDFLLDLELSALQAENKGEIVSTPRIVTANQSKATIEQGVEVPYQQSTSSGATSVSFKKAVLSLEVTPQITPEEHIIMDLKINQDTVGSVVNDIPSINTREIQTKILVDNGQTIVLGGIHEEETRNGVEKVPLLGDLPVIGNLFKKTTRQTDKRELLIFVTPKILE